jgi:hypothetical protein
MTKVLGLWEHVFHGTIQGDKVQGVAVDVPLAPGAALNSAALAIDCGGQAARTLTMTSDGPAWADHRWDKIYDTPRFVPPSPSQSTQSKRPSEDGHHKEGTMPNRLVVRPCFWVESLLAGDPARGF